MACSRLTLNISVRRKPAFYPLYIAVLALVKLKVISHEETIDSAVRFIVSRGIDLKTSGPVKGY